MTTLDVPEFNKGQLSDLREDIHSLLFKEVMSIGEELNETEAADQFAGETAEKLLNKFLRRLRPDLQQLLEGT